MVGHHRDDGDDDEDWLCAMVNDDVNGANVKDQPVNGYDFITRATRSIRSGRIVLLSKPKKIDDGSRSRRQPWLVVKKQSSKICRQGMKHLIFVH